MLFSHTMRQTYGCFFKTHVYCMLKKYDAQFMFYNIHFFYFLLCTRTFASISHTVSALTVILKYIALTRSTDISIREILYQYFNWKNTFSCE